MLMSKTNTQAQHLAHRGVLHQGGQCFCIRFVKTLGSCLFYSIPQMTIPVCQLLPLAVLAASGLKVTRLGLPDKFADILFQQPIKPAQSSYQKLSWQSIKIERPFNDSASR